MVLPMAFFRVRLNLSELNFLLGLDIDWEYPKDNCEAQNYVHLLKDTRNVSIISKAATHYTLGLSLPRRNLILLMMEEKCCSR